ncbi:MAG: type I 3-dehydroquinate dehydratase [Thermoplasmata archaeon]
MNIVLTGPMGSGKTSIGRRAAEMLDWGFADTDGMVEDAAGRSVGEIFAEHGEAHFRQIEKDAIREISKRDRTVIATGGGAVLDPGNMRRLRMNGIIIALEAPRDVLLERLKHTDERPLLADGNSRDGLLKRHLEARARQYSNADFRIDTGAVNIEKAAERVCDIAKLPAIRICACIAGRDAKNDVERAVLGGASMVEFRLDLIPDPDVRRLVEDCAVPVIATDRKNADNLRKAILAGCDFVDVDIHCADKDDIFEMARGRGCGTIVSVHDMNGVPDAIPEKGNADLLKVAATLNSTDDLKKLVGLHNRRDDVIIASMGNLGGLLRVFGPMLGSYLTYCSVGKPTATGQLDLQTMNDIYRGMKLR